MKPYSLLVKTDCSNQALLRITGVLNRFHVRVRRMQSTNEGGAGEVTVHFDGDPKTAERVLQQTRKFTEVWDAHVRETDAKREHETKIFLDGIKMGTIRFGDVDETVVTRKEFPLEKARDVLSGEIIAIIGYGVQGPAQARNLRDNGFRVIVGQRRGGRSWTKALDDGWREGETLFEIEEAAKRGTIICNLLSDAAQIETWPLIREHLADGKMLYFSHGFGVNFKDKTRIVPPPAVDVGLVAPKGSGTSVRRLFEQGRGINSSFAVYQDATGKAKDRVLALGIGIGSGYLFETTFEREVCSDLAGERGVLMGALAGMIEAQFNELRKRGHSPSEAFNETVEELTQSLVPLVGENGMEWMFANCSTTAQRGALDWRHRFRDAAAPVFSALYDSVASGAEAERVISANGRPDYREALSRELESLGNEECWRAGRAVRGLRPGKE